jgi:hypothetical protein
LRDQLASRVILINRVLAFGVIQVNQAPEQIIIAIGECAVRILDAYLFLFPS